MDEYSHDVVGSREMMMILYNNMSEQPALHWGTHKILFHENPFNLVDCLCWSVDEMGQTETTMF